eukprot:TRINITY_DN197358_c0_g1_i1.p1 TRINITY_DN197358_c0_g1~~TRINITY_DN197358_c0_g1_i1.p1  ORF type:complete len:146 (+),score=3.27 TRINITY_DN197358_c0_g1_i1:8-445(+)
MLVSIVRFFLALYRPVYNCLWKYLMFCPQYCRRRYCHPVIVNITTTVHIDFHCSFHSVTGSSFIHEPDWVALLPLPTLTAASSTVAFTAPKPLLIRTILSNMHSYRSSVWKSVVQRKLCQQSLHATQQEISTAKRGLGKVGTYHL